jgi:hypothetical protein
MSIVTEWVKVFDPVLRLKVSADTPPVSTVTSKHAVVSENTYLDKPPASDQLESSADEVYIIRFPAVVDFLPTTGVAVNAIDPLGFRHNT